jgi:hypothetical protein
MANQRPSSSMGMSGWSVGLMLICLVMESRRRWKVADA